jgi:hypothetical protein
MAYFTLAALRGDAFTETSEPAAAPLRRNWFRRIIEAAVAARQRQADREIARFLMTRGGKITDESEREIMQRFLPRSAGQFKG